MLMLMYLTVQYNSLCNPFDLEGISLLDATPAQMTRARYAAYALGLPDYLIHTSHPTNRDYQRHISSNKDPAKAYKSWRKEIITKNSEVFEFLKLDLLNSSQDRLVAAIMTMAVMTMMAVIMITMMVVMMMIMMFMQPSLS